jgi:predicted Zn-dependent protease
MNANGYDPHQAPKLWENLIAEDEAAENDDPDPFFASHPPSEERMETLAEHAAASSAAPTSDSTQFHRLMAPHRADWLEDEIALRRFAEMQVVLERLKESGHNPGVVWYDLGEVLRRNVEVEDKTEAVAAFRKALEFDDAPAVTYRSLGLLLAYQGDPDGAHSAYQSYLSAAPDADDAEMIQFYMKKLETRS